MKLKISCRQPAMLTLGPGFCAGSGRRRAPTTGRCRAGFRDRGRRAWSQRRSAPCPRSSADAACAARSRDATVPGSGPDRAAGDPGVSDRPVGLHGTIWVGLDPLRIPVHVRADPGGGIAVRVRLLPELRVDLQARRPLGVWLGSRSLLRRAWSLPLRLVQPPPLLGRRNARVRCAGLRLSGRMGRARLLQRPRLLWRRQSRLLGASPRRRLAFHGAPMGGSTERRWAASTERRWAASTERRWAAGSTERRWVGSTERQWAVGSMERRWVVGSTAVASEASSTAAATDWPSPGALTEADGSPAASGDVASVAGDGRAGDAAAAAGERTPRLIAVHSFPDGVRGHFPFVQVP